MGLFSRQEMTAAFEREGLTARWVGKGGLVSGIKGNPSGTVPWALSARSAG